MNNLSDLLNASTTVLQDQMVRWSTMLDRMRKGTYTASELLSDVVGIWDSWVVLAALPSQPGPRAAGQLPTVLLIMDGVAETVGPAHVLINLSLPPGVTLEMTDLHQIGGSGVLDKEHVLPVLLPDGSSVEVRLVNLVGKTNENLAKQLPSGLYVGPVYARELATYRSIAIVFVLVTEEAPTTEKAS